jgi:hypothetical protein
LYRSFIVARVLVSTISFLLLVACLIIRTTSVIVSLEHPGLVATSAVLYSRAPPSGGLNVETCMPYAIQLDDVLFVRIDINDWPSFRGCRPVAATHMAQHILTRAQQRGLL